MKHLHRYILMEIMKYFGIVLCLVMGIFITVDYLGTMDEFLSADISLLRALVYVLLKTPFIAAQLIPLVFFLAVLITFGLMSKNNEILILKSSGVSHFHLLQPVMAAGVAFTLFMFLLSEVIVPSTMTKANHIKYVEIRKQKQITTQSQNIWIKGHRLITHIQLFLPASDTAVGVTRYFFDDQFHLFRRVDAKKAVFKNGEWTLHDVMAQRLDSKTEDFRTTFHDMLTEHLELEPENIKTVVLKSEEMGFRELYQTIRKVESEGYDATTYRVDLQAKAAFPFLCLILSLMGTGLTARGKLRGLPTSITYGILTYFFYWVFHNFCLSLGYGEQLPPFLAAWTANLVFLCLSAVTLLNAD